MSSRNNTRNDQVGEVEPGADVGAEFDFGPSSSPSYQIHPLALHGKCFDTVRVRNVHTDEVRAYDTLAFLQWYHAEGGEKNATLAYLGPYMKHMTECLSQFSERAAIVADPVFKLQLAVQLRTSYLMGCVDKDEMLRRRAGAFVDLEAFIRAEMMYGGDGFNEKGMTAPHAEAFLLQDCFASGTWLVRRNSHARPYPITGCDVFVISIKDDSVNDYARKMGQRVSHYRFVHILGAGVFQWPHTRPFSTLAEMFAIHADTPGADPATIQPVAASFITTLLSLNRQQFVSTKFLMPYAHPYRELHS